MAQPTTIEEAVARQLEMHRRIDAGEKVSEKDWRGHSLREGYVRKLVPEYGMGPFSVRPDGTVCEWKGEWFADGKVLLCTECFADGT